MARGAAMIGIATGIVGLTAVAALAVGNPSDDDGDTGDHPTGLQHPRGQEQAEWARDHHGPPPWSHGHGHGKKDKHEKAEKKERSS
jgi:hypothetical protein